MSLQLLLPWSPLGCHSLGSQPSVLSVQHQFFQGQTAAAAAAAAAHPRWQAAGVILPAAPAAPLVLVLLLLLLPI
jgi:hypothetical protein